MSFGNSTACGVLWARRGVAAAAGLLVTLCFSGNAAQAFPKFSQKEKKPCSYCHVNASGGGKRNAAGTWYKAHGLSFAGYTPEKAAQAAGGGIPTSSGKKPATATKKPGAKKPTPPKPAKKK